MKVIRGICRFFTWFCMLLIVALMLLMVAEVLDRALFGRSILGSTEWAQVLLLCNMTALGTSILSNRQIKVNMLTSHFSPKAQVILDFFMLLLAFAVIAVVAWQQVNFAVKSHDNHVFYSTIGLPQWPFIAMFALSYAVGAITTLSLAVRKVVCMVRGDWEREAKREDMDEIFVFGKKRAAEMRAAEEKRQNDEGGDAK